MHLPVFSTSNQRAYANSHDFKHFYDWPRAVPFSSEPAKLVNKTSSLTATTERMTNVERRIPLTRKPDSMQLKIEDKPLEASPSIDKFHFATIFGISQPRYVPRRNIVKSYNELSKIAKLAPLQLSVSPRNAIDVKGPTMFFQSKKKNQFSGK
ncbi:hypothetical protein TKK_0013643 [Trichogramma kaykai]